MYTRLLFKSEGRREMAEGVKKLVNAVKVTLGGNGKNVVILNKTDNPHVTKDGVTVANNIVLRNDVQQGGVNIVRQASRKAAEETGDGSSTAVVLAGYLVENGIDLVETRNIQKMRDGMEFAYSEISKKLDEMSSRITSEETLINIAKISANGDKNIGEIIGKNIFENGCDSKYTVELLDDNSGLTFEKVEGYNYTKEMSLHFENVPGTGKTILEKARIAIIDGYLGDKTKLIDLAEFSERTKTPVIVMYKEIDGNLLQDLAKKFNDYNRLFTLLPIQLPDYGELQDASVKDLAVCTGAKPISSLAKETLKEEILGYVDYFEINGNQIKLLFDRKFKDDIQKLSENLKNSYETVREESAYLYKNRYERTSSGGGVFKIGRPTEVDRREMKDKVDDAIGSVLSALKEGFVQGGGVALLNAVHDLKHKKFDDDSFQDGYNLVVEACEEPFKQIISNCGVDNSEELKQRIVESGFKLGYNSREKKEQNLIENGIIDATKVVKVSLQSAISSAVGLLTTDCVLFPEDNFIETAYCAKVD